MKGNDLFSSEKSAKSLFFSHSVAVIRNNKTCRENMLFPIVSIVNNNNYHTRLHHHRSHSKELFFFSFVSLSSTDVFFLRDNPSLPPFYSRATKHDNTKPRRRGLPEKIKEKFDKSRPITIYKPQRTADTQITG